MWMLIVVGLILLFLLILTNQNTTEANEKTKKEKPTGYQLGENSDPYVELYDEEDELLEEFLIIDLLDEEDEEY